MRYLTIGKLARATGTSVETIRFYERSGLLPPARRRESGYREYTEEDVRRLRFIRRAKALGFSLREIKELLELRTSPTTTCEEVRHHAEAKIAAIEAKIAELQRVKQALEELAASCYGSEPQGECPILEALDRVERDD